MRCIILTIDGLGIGSLPKENGIEQNDTKKEKINLNSLQNLSKYGLSYLINSKSENQIESSFGRMAMRNSMASLYSSLGELIGVQSFNSLDSIYDLKDDDLEDIKKELNLDITTDKNYFEDNGDILLTPSLNNKLIIKLKNTVSKDQVDELSKKLINEFNIDEILSIKKDKEKEIYVKKIPQPNLFSDLIRFNYQVKTIGTTNKYFDYNDISERYLTSGDEETLENLIDIMEEKFDGVIFALFDDFYKKIEKRDFVIKRFDGYIPIIVNSMKDDDILFITSTTGVEEHSYKRTHEYVPIIIKGAFIKEDTYVGVRHSACDMAQTIVDMFGINKLNYGKSFKKLITEG